MVPYVTNLDLFEDYPRAPEDAHYDEDLFASCKRHSVPHIDDIIFHMSHDPDFYSTLDLQSAFSLEGRGASDFILEPDIRRSHYDYPREAAEGVDPDDWYPPHPELDVVLARFADLQLEAPHCSAHDGKAYAHQTTADVPSDAIVCQTTNTRSDKALVQSETGRQQTQYSDPSVRQHSRFSVRLSLLFPSRAPYAKPVKNGEEEQIHSNIPNTSKHLRSQEKVE